MPTSIARTQPLWKRISREAARFARGEGALPPPGKGAWNLFVSTFFFFSTIGYINVLWRTQSVMNVPGVLLAGATAGVIAIGYAWAIAYRRWWFLVVPLAFHFDLATRLVFVPLYKLGLLGSAPIPSPEATASRLVAVWGTILGLALGQIFIMRFIAQIVRSAALDRAEIAVAQRMHASIVPGVRLEGEGFVVDGVSDTSTRMGGDLCDALRVGHDTYALVADVSGHGVGAGLVMAMVKGCVRARLMQGGELPAIVGDINRVLCTQLTDGAFVTLAMARVGGGEVEVALAGHPPALVVGKQGVRRIENANLPLGLVEGEVFASTPVHLQPGETLVLYTDGLYERPDERRPLERRDVGLDGLAELVQAGMTAGEQTAAKLMPRLRGQAAPADDQTLLVLRRDA
jgi:hypothetical protein